MPPNPIGPRPLSRFIGPSLALALALPVASAQSIDPVAPKAEPEKSVLIPALEIVAFDFLLNRVNQRFSGTSDYNVTAASVRRNLRGPWVVDNDPFSVNQFAHPYQGALYHGAGRSTGLNYWESSALTFAGSAAWELFGEKTPPARNDQIASGIAGSFLGEPLFRMAHLALRVGGSVPPELREWVAGAVSPPVALNRLAFGSRFDSAFEDHNPSYYGRSHLGFTHVAKHESGAADTYKANMAQADFAIDYGQPGQAGYTYDRPFDYFNLRFLISSANGVENLSTTGMLVGTGYGVGDNYRGVWGLYGHYDYLAPQIFNLSTTALSVGTVGQAWLSRTLALQGSVMAGMGYAAANTTVRTVTPTTEYHYGVAPRFALAMRAISGDRASFDLSAKLVSMGRTANRSAGSDDITRIDSALTWRIAGQHAIGINYLWSDRNLQYPAAGGRRQTLGTVGIYYTMLSSQGLGAVDWRAPTAN